MAYIIRVVYENGEEELVPIWSQALNKEIEVIFNDNPSLELYEIKSSDPSEEECSYIHENMKKTVYRLPQHYKKNRQRRKK